MRKLLLNSATYLIPFFCLIFIFSSGCASQQTRQFNKKQKDVLKSYRLHVSEAVKDPERAHKLIVLGEDLHREITTYSKTLQKLSGEFSSLNKNYDTQREELETFFHSLNQHRIKMRESILATRIEAIKLLTPEEWSELMKRRNTLMDLINATPGFL